MLNLFLGDKYHEEACLHTKLSQPSCRHTIFWLGKSWAKFGQEWQKCTNFELIPAQSCRHTKRLAQNCTNRSGQNLPKSSPKVAQPQFADTFYSLLLSSLSPNLPSSSEELWFIYPVICLLLLSSVVYRLTLIPLFAGRLWTLFFGLSSYWQGKCWG